MSGDACLVESHCRLDRFSGYLFRIFTAGVTRRSISVSLVSRAAAVFLCFWCGDRQTDRMRDTSFQLGPFLNHWGS